MNQFSNILLESDRVSAKPLDNRPIYEWAEDNITLPSAYAKPGPFSVVSSNYLKEPFNAIQSHSTPNVCVVAPVQSGKTLLADISVAWAIANRPAAVQWTFFTKDMVKNHFLPRFLPMLRSSPALRPLLPRDERKMTQEGIEFPHMVLFANGASKGPLQAKSISFAILDEVWLWKPSMLQQAISRTAAFARIGAHKILVVSQAGTVGDDLAKHYAKGTCEEYAVPCLGCGKHFIPKWEHIKWVTDEKTKSETGYDFTALAPTIRLHCPVCNHAHIDTPTLKSKWNYEGHYMQTNESPLVGFRSFHWNALILDTWSSLVEGFLSARHAYREYGLIEPIITFVQQRLAEPQSPERAHESNTVVKTGDYVVTSAWDKEVARYMTVDVQENSYWAVIRAWAANGDSRQLWFGNVITEGDLLAKQQEFQVANHRVYVDTGHDTRRIYGMLIRNGWIGLKGDGNHEHFNLKIKGVIVQKLYSPLKFGDAGMGTSTQGTKFARYLFFAANPIRNVLKRMVDGRLAEFVSLANPIYEKQMRAEKLLPCVSKTTGRISYIWKQLDKSNHAFDCEVMQTVAALLNKHIRMDMPPPLKKAEVKPEEVIEVEAEESVAA